MSTARFVEQSMFPDIKPDKAVGPIPASVQRGTNGELMRTIAPLYLTGSVLDVTYGEGKWWTDYQPADFTAHDLHKLDGVDFTALPELDRSVDTVCFDPPYVAAGGVGNAGDFQHRYGVGSSLNGVTAGDVRSLAFDGLAECARVARQWVLVKCMEFASGGFNDMPFLVREHAHRLGLVTHDVIVHHTGSGPGGHNIFTPIRARRHHSYLLVFGVPA